MKGKANLTVIIIIILIAIIALFLLRQPPEPSPEPQLQEVIVFAMTEDGDNVAADDARFDILTSAESGFLLLEINEEVVAATGLSPVDNADLGLFVEALQTTGKRITLREQIEEERDALPTSYGVDLDLEVGVNAVTAAVYALDKSALQVSLVAQQSLSVVGLSFDPLRDRDEFNVTVSRGNATVIARLNITRYGLINNSGVSSPPFPGLNISYINGSITLVNGTIVPAANASVRNTLSGFFSLVGVWMVMDFLDVAVPGGFTEWRWIQVITTTFVRESGTKGAIVNPPVSYVDPPRNSPGADGRPFYYDDLGSGGALPITPARRHHFSDHAKRVILNDSGNRVPFFWRAELCHVGVRAGQPDIILNSCITYGYSADGSGNVRLDPLRNPGAPSQNLRDTVRRDFPRYRFR